MSLCMLERWNKKVNVVAERQHKHQEAVHAPWLKEIVHEGVTSFKRIKWG
jgi:hypothetical protein